MSTHLLLVMTLRMSRTTHPVSHITSGLGKRKLYLCTGLCVKSKAQPLWCDVALFVVVTDVNNKVADINLIFISTFVCL
jgi:hypothetical protein